jgi:hypothetical protein
MKTLKSIFRATAADGRNGFTVSGVGSVKGDLSEPKLRDGQRKPAIAIPEHLFGAPDSPLPNDPDLRQVLALLLGHFVKRIARGRWFRSRPITARRG